MDKHFTPRFVCMVHKQERVKWKYSSINTRLPGWTCYSTLRPRLLAGRTSPNTVRRLEPAQPFHNTLLLPPCQLKSSRESPDLRLNPRRNFRGPARRLHSGRFCRDSRIQLCECVNSRKRMSPVVRCTSWSVCSPHNRRYWNSDETAFSVSINLRGDTVFGEISSQVNWSDK